jgi:hypothetical protein
MENQELSPRTQRIIEHLRDRWQRPYQPSVDQIQRITELTTHLSEQYSITGLRVISEHILNNMYLHILDLIAVFQHTSEQEGFSPEDCQEILDDTLPGIFYILENLNKHIVISSFDDVAVLTNITISLQMLSRADTAENALTWLYELPRIYPQRLQKEELLSNDYPCKQPISAASPKNSTI